MANRQRPGLLNSFVISFTVELCQSLMLERTDSYQALRFSLFLCTFFDLLIHLNNILFADSSLTVKDVVKEFHPGGRLAQHRHGEVRDLFMHNNTCGNTLFYRAGISLFFEYILWDVGINYIENRNCIKGKSSIKPKFIFIHYWKPFSTLFVF